jgi:drug/metabolite transporter (DMT)-like permease
MDVNRRFWLGSFCALCSAIAFALNISLARVAYDYGANIHALNGFRSVTFLSCLTLVIVLGRKSISIPHQDKFVSIVLGILLCAEMYVLLAAIKLIPVALAILIMYTYPMMIALYGWIGRKKVLSISSLIMMLTTFAGLFFALNGSDLQLNVMGMFLAFLAAVTLATLLVLSEKTLHKNDNNVVMFYMLLSATGIIALLSLYVVELSWPATIEGWIPFCGSSIFYVVATFLLFQAVNLVGPLQTAIIDNTSPIWAIVFSFLLLNQTLGAHQVLGALVVVSAVMILQWLNRPANTALKEVYELRTSKSVE